MRKNLFTHVRKPGLKNKVGNMNIAHAKTIGRSLYDITKHDDEGFNLTDIANCEEQYRHYDIFTKQTRK